MAALAIPPLDAELPFASEAVQQSLCKCETSGVWLCQPCGRSIRAADHEYQRYSYPVRSFRLTPVTHIMSASGAGATSTERCWVGSAPVSEMEIEASYAAAKRRVSRPETASTRWTATHRMPVIAARRPGSTSSPSGPRRRLLRHQRLVRQPVPLDRHLAQRLPSDL